MKRKKTSADVAMRQLRGRWRDQVMEDLNLTYLHRVVAYFLADYITMRDTMQHYISAQEIVIFCSQAGIAEKVGSDQADVSRAVGVLARRQHILKVRRGLATRLGYGTNEYLVLLGDRKDRKRAAANVERIRAG